MRFSAEQTDASAWRLHLRRHHDQLAMASGGDDGSMSRRRAIDS